MYKLDNSNGAQVVYVVARNDKDGNPRRGWHITVRWRGYVSRIEFVRDDPYTNDGVKHLKSVVDIGERHAYNDFPTERITVAEYESLLYKNRV